jgi:hypothetical protein
MSKMDNLRAMREARYEADRARAKATGATPATKAPTRPASETESAAGSAPKSTATRRPAKAPAPTDAPSASAEALCGHRNMGGRTCTRELGHAAKSHRYS